MKFGGHETFPIREGWLHKGLTLLRDSPNMQSDPYVADHLGVGRNMAKSIWHWLKVTRLVDVVRESKSPRLVLSDLGTCILEQDPYQLETGTWWALHANIVTQSEQSVVWSWFFNEYATERFDRAQCLAHLSRKLEIVGMRKPRSETLARDLQCLLLSYARPYPMEKEDPEDANECPFRELGLLSHHRDTGIYTFQRGIKEIPPEMIGYIIALTDDDPGDAPKIRIPLKVVLSGPRMPGRVLGLSGEELALLLQDAEKLLGTTMINVRAFGGERMLEVTRTSPADWLEYFYMRVRST